MTLLHNKKKNEDQLLVADNSGKFKFFDKNTFEILATFVAPIYDANVKQFVSIYGATIQIDFGLKAPIKLSKNDPFFIQFPLRSFSATTTSRAVSQLIQTFSSSQQIKIFVFTRCPSMEIHFEAWAHLDTAMVSDQWKLTKMENFFSQLATKVNQFLCGELIQGKIKKVSTKRNFLSSIF